HAPPIFPLHTASLQTRYHLATLPGVSLGGTLVYAGERAGDPTHSFDLPSYTRFDLAAYYVINNNLQLDLLANNVTDEEIYSPGSFSGVLREEGRTYLARVKYFFWRRARRWPPCCAKAAGPLRGWAGHR